jgi:predicted ATPase
MIGSVEIQNLRGIKDGKLDELTPLVILVGPNGSGKSTVLDALLVGASPVPGDAVGRAVRRHQGVRYGARWLLWKSGREGDAEVEVRTDSGGIRRSRISVDLARPEEKAVLRWSLIGTERTPELPHPRGIEIRFEDRNRYEAPGTAEFWADRTEVRFVEASAADLQTPLHTLLTEVHERGRHKEAEGIVAEVVPGFPQIRILTEGDSPIVHLGFESHSVPAALAGDGIHALVRLSLELASRERGTVLLEEPEVHQHPAALRQTARAIIAAVRRDIQVILTTHSLELIDALLSESLDADLDRLALYSLALEQGTLKSARIPGREVSLVRTTIEEDLR